MTRCARTAWWFVLATLLGLLAVPAMAQGQEPELPQETREALEALAGRIDDAVQRRAVAATGNDTKAVAAIDDELRDLRWQLGGITARTDVKEFEAPEKSAFDLQAELVELLRPVVEMAKDFTADSRQIESLKRRAATLNARRQRAQEALRESIAMRDRLPADSPARGAIDWEIEQRWRPTIDELVNELVIVSGQRKAIEEGRKDFLDTLGEGARGFYDKSGKSLLYGTLVFCAVFFASRWLQGRLLRNRETGRRTSLRVLEVVLATLGLLLAILSALIVPYVRDDWLLMPICILILLGTGWVLLKMLPQFYEQIRLVLNIGPVREGERLILDGLAWRVDQLRFYSRLSNPDLQGGVLRLPIQSLIGKCSRRGEAIEPWFPSRTGDYVSLDDGVFGKVLLQTPETVVLDDIAAPKSYPTPAFLAGNPRNLSRGFGVRATFGIDYRHQREATTTIPQLLTAAVREGLTAMVPAEQIRRVQVEFMAANSSSLDFNARADFTGDAAPLWREINRALQRLLVDACTQNDWNIPFPQLTVHGNRSAD
ncbi:MAG: hypothetical protein KDC98_03270 [Planctomycetes bacterium]|nr:hypothetical protein [Planctomycetota bacterium]